MDNVTAPQEALHPTESTSKVELRGNGTPGFHWQTDLKDIPASHKTILTDSGTNNGGTIITLLRGRDLASLKKVVEQELQPGCIYVLLAVQQVKQTEQNAPTNIIAPADLLSLTVQLNSLEE